MCDARHKVPDDANSAEVDRDGLGLDSEQIEPSVVVPSEMAMLKEPTVDYVVDQASASDPILEDIIHTYMGAWKTLAS